jgi:hypothetical protein
LLLGRSDLLDDNGGTEIIPVFPSAVKIMIGKEKIQCTRLSPQGLFRFSTTWCKTPVAFRSPGLPLVGIPARMFSVTDSEILDRTLEPVKSRMMAQFAYGNVPKQASKKLQTRDVSFLLPFLAKGKLLGKSKPSPFFESDGRTSIAPPDVISLETREKLRSMLRQP